MNTTVNQVTVVSFESRMAEESRRLIESRGWKAVSAPSMREIPLGENPEALAFGEKLLAGQVDLFIAMTGVGMKMLLEILFAKYSEQEILAAFSAITVVARGPKPLKVFRDLGIPVTITIPEPNTWFEILEELDSNRKGIELKNKTVALQEYGISNPELVDGLKARGAKVSQVPVYRWALPENIGPLENAIREILSGNIQAVFFTSAQQIRNVLQMASQLGVEADLKKSFRNVVVASIGPTCSEALRECGVPPDFEPSHPKLGTLILETAQKYEEITAEKRLPQAAVEAVLARKKADTPESIHSRRESPFLKACRREKTDYTPVWLMRQAGRYMKEYRRVRDKVSFIELCRTPELCCEVTVTACEKIKADAAIIFSDILLIVESLGMNLEYSKGDGPVITGQIKSAAEIDALNEFDPQSLSYVYAAIRLTRSCLDSKTPLLGFSGAPFTLASYMIEGGGSKNFVKTKQLMYSDKGAWDALMAKISRGIVKYLKAQAEAGADALQIFDSWVGCLSPEDYVRYVQPHSRFIIAQLPKDIPVIHFGTNTGTFLRQMREAGGDVIGADWRIELSEAWQRIGFDRAIQGNLDPVTLFAPLSEIKERVKNILSQAAGRPGHIFNLGHGILPGTPVENVIALVEMVHELSGKVTRSPGHKDA